MRGPVSSAFASANLIGVILSTFGAPSLARADEPKSSPTPSLPAEPLAQARAATLADDRSRRDDPILRTTSGERRAGLVLGVAPGIAFAGASGYPNNARLIGNPDFYSQSPMLVGTSTTMFLMGALTDFFSFGPMVNIATFESSSWKSTGFAVGFRAEVFPLIRLFPKLADTSLYGQAGVGGTELQAKGPFPSADGSQSFAGVGAHHEFRLFRMLGGHLAGGPYAEYDAIFTTSAERHWASVGFRVAWYGGGVTLDAR